MRSWSLRTRLAAGTTAITLLLICAASTAVYLFVQAQLEEGLERQLDTRLADTRSAIRQMQRRAIPQYVARSDSPGSDAVVQVLASTGTLIASSEPSLKRSIVTRKSVAGLRGGVPITVATGAFGDEAGRAHVGRVRTANGKLVLAVVAVSAEATDDTLEALAFALLLGSPLLITLITFTAVRQVDESLRAVSQMQQHAARISVADLSERVPMPQARDQIHRLATTLNAMLDRLQLAADQQRQFVATAGHELRTPLAVIKGELEFAVQDALTAHSDVRLPVSQLATITAELDRLALLVDALLLLAEQEQEGLELSREPVNLRTLIGHVCDRYSTRAEAAQRLVECQSAADGVEIAGDALLIEHAVANLVDNALRHGAGRVTIDLTCAAQHACIAVRDEGPGIRQELRERAFDRFVRGAPRDGRGGTGLGLSIVRSIVEAHGGSAEIQDGFALIKLPLV